MKTIIKFIQVLFGTGKPCPKCGKDTLDGDNLAAWCESCDWNNFGSY